MSEIPEAEFRAMFAEFLCNPVAYRALADRMMTEEAIASAGLVCIDPPESTKEHLETIEQVRATIYEACTLKQKPTARSAGGK